MKLSSPIETIKAAIKIFLDKNNLPNFVKVYLPLLPFSIFSIWQGNTIRSYEDLTNNGLIGIIILINLAYLLVYLWTTIAGIMVIQKTVDSQAIVLPEIYKNSWKILWKFSLLALIVSLAQFGGALLLIYPGLVFAVWYSFSKFIFIEGESRILNALGRSRNLVKGRFWKVTGRELAFVIVTTIVGVIFAILPFNLGGIFTTIFGAFFVLPYYLLYRELAGQK